MRTLHKGLAMLLVVIMVLGLGAFTAVAAPTDIYKDADQINETYKEAFDVLTHIGVFDGYEDETIRPDDPLTRVNGAKILTAVLGNPNPTGTTTSFTDVDDWAKGYVAFIEVNGISDGVAENLFGSQMELTGSMFAKWLLVGLGYNAETEGMTGTPWEINIAKLVRLTELDAGLEDYDPTKVITRQEAAQMALNALKTPMVEYDNRVTITSGDNVISVSGQATPILSSASYAANISDNGNWAYLQRGYYVELGEQYWRDLKLNYGIDTDDFGRPASTWTYKSVDIGTYVSYADRIFSSTTKVSKKDLYTKIGRSAYENMTSGGDDELYVYVDGAEQLPDGSPYPNQTQINTFIGNYISNGNGDATGAGNGALTELYRVRKDNLATQYDEYTLVIINTYLVQATTDYSEASKSIRVAQVSENGQGLLPKFKNEIKQSDFDVEDVKLGDYLLVTYSFENNKEGIKSVEPATLVSGEVEAYVSTKNVKIDGTTYSYNRVVGTDGEKSSAAPFSVGNEAVLVMDSYGYIIAVDNADANANYLYVRKSQGFVGDGYVRAYFLDGTTKVIEVKNAKDANGENIVSVSDDLNILANQWFKYSVDSSGRYTLTIPKDYNNRDYGPETYAGAVSNSKSLRFLQDETGKSLPFYGTEKTVLLVLDNEGNINVYEGVSNIPTVKADGPVTIGYMISSPYILYAFIDGSAANLDIEDGAENKDLLFLLSKGTNLASDVASNATYYECDVVLNGETKKGVRIESGRADLMEVGVLYTSLKYNEYGWLESAREVSNARSAKEYSASEDTASRITLSGKTLMLGAAELNVSGASLNLIINASTGLVSGAGLNSDMCPTTPEAIVSTLSKDNYKFTWYATYLDDCDDHGSGLVKALYVYITGKETAPVGKEVSGWTELKKYLDGTFKAADDIKSAGSTIVVTGNLEIPSDYDGTDLFAQITSKVTGNVNEIIVRGSLTNASPNLTITGRGVSNIGTLDVRGKIINDRGASITVNGDDDNTVIKCLGVENSGTITINAGDFTANGEVVESDPTCLHIYGGKVTLNAGLRVTNNGRVDIGSDHTGDAVVKIKGGITTTSPNATVEIVSLDTSSEIDTITATYGDVVIGGTDGDGQASNVQSGLITDALTVGLNGDVTIEKSLTIPSLTVNGDLAIEGTASVLITKSVSGSGDITVGASASINKAPTATDNSKVDVTGDGASNSNVGKVVGTITLDLPAGYGATVDDNVSFSNGTYTVSVDATGSVDVTITNGSELQQGTDTLPTGVSCVYDEGTLTITVSTMPSKDWTATITLTKKPTE